jgi:hypothetical protein
MLTGIALAGQYIGLVATPQSSMAWYAAVQKSRWTAGGFGDVQARWVNRIPVGTYNVFAALFRQGSLADNVLGDGDLVWLDFFPLTYAP